MRSGCLRIRRYVPQNNPLSARRRKISNHYILIGVKRRVLTVGRRNLCPQALRTASAAIPYVEGNDLAAGGVHGNPEPLFIGFFLHKAGHFIGFHFQALDENVPPVGHRLDMEMIG